MSFLVIPEITENLPNFNVDTKSLAIPEHIQLADSNFHTPAKVDLLLGADCFWNVMCDGPTKLFRDGPFLQNTRFGWIISGPIQANYSNSVVCNLSKNSLEDEQFTRFWEIEEVPSTKPLSMEEKLCESHFIQNTVRSFDGRFIVTIPLKDDPAKLGNSYENAKRRFLSLERRFESNSELKIEYSKFIHEYLSLGHMKPVSENDKTDIAYYLPHHGVIKESSTTTKLRVVFDASCPTTSNFSLNDLQMVGPTIQPDIFSALIRYRKYNFVVAGDVEKMYRMCLINPAQTALQRILWRDNPNESLKSYELQTVTYGTSSASFLAIRCLYQLGVESNSAIVSEVIKNHFYVDDMLSGGPSEQDVVEMVNEVIRALAKGGFKLRKFVSNSTEILKQIESDCEASSIDLGSNENTKTLGISWNGKSDSFIYKIDISQNKRVTKRTILSEISQIFDPLGLLSPCIIIAKIILQNLWSEKLAWDETVSANIHTKWLQFRNELVLLNDITIPRHVICKDPTRIEIHGFSDASMHAYGACVYIRSQNTSGEISVKLVCSRSKVAPLKAQTIPRLELMGAVLLTKLIDKVQCALQLSIDSITYWCDSTIVLGWIKISPSQLQTFVSNRVGTIQEISDITRWRHVPTGDNPADYVSRGVMPNSLISLDTYWHGPAWLCDDEVTWPSLKGSVDELPELRKTIKSHKVVTQEYVIPFENYSNLTNLQRIVAYCLRFKLNALTKLKDKRNSGPLTADEISAANLVLVRLSQCETFSDELKCLKANKDIHSSSKLLKLNPFLDNNNIIRVGGRLANADIKFDKRHPIVLSSKHKYTELLFQREHLRLLHAGPQLLLASLRNHYWPISGRNYAKKITHNCVRCFKAKPRVVNPIMGNLPKERVNPSPPFYVTGVDYAGAFKIKDRKGRGCKITKCYVALFVCFTTRAVHLELVSDLTTEAFLAAFKRFISRRGKPYKVFSDNGTNFVSASSELQNFGRFLKQNTSQLTEVIANDGINWSFIPAYSPHFGGIWEAGVKSMKFHLLRVAGNALLTFEQFYTLLVQIEAVLNSRPISPMSSDPSDLSPLTPSHFLIGRILISAPEENLMAIQENRLSHFRLVQRLHQHFWSRWSREYVTELQTRTKWHSDKSQIKLNDLVVIKEDNQPPMKWLLGRIVRLHPGRDGVSRVATIRTHSGEIKRSFAKICPLPICEGENDTEC